VPKVGQWGQLCVRVVRYKNTLQLNQKLPKPHKLELLTRLYNLQKYTKMYNRYKSIQDIQERLSNHTLGPSMPQVALTPLGLPSLASNHKSTQGSNK
jgi:hypothetical protein